MIKEKRRNKKQLDDTYEIRKKTKYKQTKKY